MQKIRAGFGSSFRWHKIKKKETNMIFELMSETAQQQYTLLKDIRISTRASLRAVINAGEDANRSEASIGSDIAPFVRLIDQINVELEDINKAQSTIIWTDSQ